MHFRHRFATQLVQNCGHWVQLPVPELNTYPDRQVEQPVGDEHVWQLAIQGSHR